MARCFDLWFVCNTTPSCQRLATFTENTILSEGVGRSGQRPREGVGRMVVRERDADGKRMRAVTMREKKREVKRVEMQKEKDKERQRY